MENELKTVIWYEKDLTTKLKTGRTFCVIWDGPVRYVGVAACSKKDQFNKSIAKKIAEGRALKAQALLSPIRGEPLEDKKWVYFCFHIDDAPQWMNPYLWKIVNPKQ